MGRFIIIPGKARRLYSGWSIQTSTAAVALTIKIETFDTPTSSLSSRVSVFNLNNHIRFHLLEFARLFGILCGGLDPPSFQRAQREKMTKSLSQACTNESSDLAKSLNAAWASQKEELCTHEPESIGVDAEHAAAKDGKYGESNRNVMSVRTHVESESLSDLDDLEINLYLNNEEESQYKKIIWEKLNWKYIKEQAAKEVPEKMGFKGLQATRQRDKSTTALVAKSRKGKKQRQTQEAKSSGSDRLDPKATEALRKKRLSSKVNFEMVEKLFDEPAARENPKKARFEACSENHDNLEWELKNKNRGDDEVESVGEFGEDTDDMGGLHLHESTWYDDDVDEGYNYEDDDYNFE